MYSRTLAASSSAVVARSTTGGLVLRHRAYRMPPTPVQHSQPRGSLPYSAASGSGGWCAGAGGWQSWALGRLLLRQVVIKGPSGVHALGGPADVMDSRHYAMLSIDV